MPVYNVEAYLKDCVDSILNQRYRDFECIIVDDGSTDSSGIICDQYAKYDDRLKVIHIKNAGVSNARNIGIANAIGDYITFIDSDDYVTPSYLSDMVDNCATNSSCELIVSGIIHTNGTKVINTIIPNASRIIFNEECSSYFNELNRMYLLYGPSAKLYSRYVIKKNDVTFDPRYAYGEDLLFNFQYLQHIESIDVISSANYFYRKDSCNSLSKRVSTDDFSINHHQWLIIRDFYISKRMWCAKSQEHMYVRLWGIIYDSIFKLPYFKLKLKDQYSYLKAIFSSLDIENLSIHKESFSCANWIKYCILQQSIIPFLFILNLKGK